MDHGFKTTETMPVDALAVAIPVLIISIISLALSLLWFLMQHYHSERWSYVGLMAIAVCWCTTASITQQFWYMLHWHHDRTSEYEQAKIGVEQPKLAVGPLTLGPSLILFWLQMYGYNVIALLTACWAVALVRGVYNCRHVVSMRCSSILVPTSKVVCILLPVVLVTVPEAPVFNTQATAALVVICAPMFCCWAVGSVCVVAILVKYVRGLAAFTNIQQSTSVDISLQSSTGKSSKMQQTDKWLLLRFSFTFVALCAFEILIINTAITRTAACKSLAARDGPDYSIAGTIGSVLTFLPGVMAGIVGFVVFGTTSHFRKIYAESLREWCCGCRGRKKGTRLSEDEVEDARSWKALGSGGGRMPTYHCRVESAGAGNVELTGLGRGFGKTDGVVHSQQEMQRSPTKVAQPWRTLGLDPPMSNDQ